MIDVLAGAYLLTIFFPNQPLDPDFNPDGPHEFSTYQDCRMAGEVIASVLGEDFEITCKSKNTGEVVSYWGRGPVQSE